MATPHPLTPPQRSQIVAATRSRRRLLRDARSNLKAAQDHLSQLQRQDLPGLRWKILVGGWILEAARWNPDVRAWLDAELDQALTIARDRRLLEVWRKSCGPPDE